MILRFGVSAADWTLGRALALPDDARAIAETAVPTGGGPVPYIRLESGTVPEGDALVADGDLLDGVDELASGGETQLFRLDWADVPFPLFEAIRTEGGSVRTLEGDADRWRFEVRFPSESAVSAFHTRCRESEFDVRVRRLTQSVTRGGSGLTSAQRAALRRALEEGYYRVPRGVTLGELAEEADVSDTALSQLLRRGVETVLREQLSDDLGSESGR
jgi:hypothetical protein